MGFRILNEDCSSDEQDKFDTWKLHTDFFSEVARIEVETEIREEWKGS